MGQGVVTPFADEDNEAQRGKVSFQGFTAGKWWSWGSKLGPPAARVLTASTAAPRLSRC